jgi:lysophospholipase L1-like esterase
MQRASRTVYYTEYPDVGHDSWTAAYSEPFLLKWLFAQKRGTPTAPGTPAPAASLDLDEMPVPAAFPEVGQLQTADWFKRLWKQRRSAWRQSTAADRGKIVFLGDSITQGWESALAKDFPSLAIANRGISGDTSRGVRLRLDRDVIALDPAAVSLLIGTNDLALGGTPEQVATHIRAIVRNLRKAKPNLPIILNLVMPRGVAPGLFPEKIRDLNDSIRKLAADEKTSLCDSWTPFDDGTGSCRREEFPDMLHPNEAGYAKWKGALQPILDSFGVSGKP